MNANPNPIRILTVDDHPLIRQGIMGLIANQPDMALVGEAANGREAMVMVAVTHEVAGSGPVVPAS